MLQIFDIRQKPDLWAYIGKGYLLEDEETRIYEYKI